MNPRLGAIRMGTFSTSFQCFLREAQWEMRDGAGGRVGKRVEEGFLPGQPRQRMQVRSPCLHEGLCFHPRPHKISQIGTSCLCRVFFKPPTSKTPLFLCFKVPLKSWNKFASLFSQTYAEEENKKNTYFLSRNLGQ